MILQEMERHEIQAGTGHLECLSERNTLQQCTLGNEQGLVRWQEGMAGHAACCFTHVNSVWCLVKHKFRVFFFLNFLEFYFPLSISDLCSLKPAMDIEGRWVVLLETGKCFIMGPFIETVC